MTACAPILITILSAVMVSLITPVLSSNSSISFEMNLAVKSKTSILLFESRPL